MAHKRPSIAEIFSSRLGDETSLMDILEKYEDYINLYSMYTLKDGRGKECLYLDHDCRQYIYLRVLRAVRQFDPDY
ncbi:MAG: helix-turn-helix domain-containing protein [Clostridiales bacterium]|jgi:hypothetical protein|nr:helix-turn-helix domain-containing protein [Eubacteriales bacterium]MDH7566518.1 helix-turn-helix domain-containing protein [Clostridiales bacterium]